VESPDPALFMRQFAEAVADAGNVFLVDPAWRSAERAVLARHLAAHGSSDKGWLMIPSGGASGSLKFARHDEDTIAEAVGGFRTHFGIDRVNSVGVLPLHHVGGFMAWMRSVLSGGSYLPYDWKEIEAGRYPADLPRDCCISLVPTQLQRLLRSRAAVEWLKGFRIVFLGGAPSWEGLLAEAARHGIPLSMGYGTTETAAMAAGLKPGQFLMGGRGCGAALPHARIEVAADGMVSVSGESLFRGYFPEMRSERTWSTGDLGEFDAQGSLVILGRSDDVIMTGGKKVSPGEVEAVLRSSGEFDDVAVVGVADPEWGQIVVACFPSGGRSPSAERLRETLFCLAPYKHPKRTVPVTPWPRNAQGKIRRNELARLASESLGS
jgi:O-succinylbenzoic acid--CoA ligase